MWVISVIYIVAVLHMVTRDVTTTWCDGVTGASAGLHVAEHFVGVWAGRVHGARDEGDDECHGSTQ